jgi:hypothetical protein
MLPHGADEGDQEFESLSLQRGVISEPVNG